MKQPLNPEKSKKLRPLRIALAVLIAVLIVLILDRLPTSVKDRETNQNQTQTQNNWSAEPSSAKTHVYYYYFNGFLELLEDQTEEKLQKLGVPKEEYKNVSEYLTKDELFELETKATLAANLEEVYVETTDDGVKELKKIFGLSDAYSFEKFQKLTAAPSEYKVLADLLSEYHKTLNTTEDYDAPAE
ncbi:hypothetical protein IIZ77_00780 [Candidatus Saccharibacteria bacterium]|nr:hypothetical protein [Candidatus Saccharibacteria bacterium]